MTNYITYEELKMKIPFGCIIAGPSSSGKTKLCLKLLENANKMFEPEPKAIIYAYGQFNNLIPKLVSMGIHTVQGEPPDSLLASVQKPYLLILDDLMYDLTPQWLSSIYTKRSHHEGFGVIMLVQDMYEKRLKVPRINSMYLFLLRAPNSLLSVRNLGTQLWPRELSYFMDAYKQATSENYGYLFIDLHPSSKQVLRLRSNIFPGEKTQLYIPKKGF
jgi:RecA/RadA recombinase